MESHEDDMEIEFHETNSIQGSSAAKNNLKFELKASSFVTNGGEIISSSANESK